MSNLMAIGGGFLLLATVSPLALLALYVAADHFGLGIADRLLDLTARVMTLQWLVGAWVNIIGGLVLAGVGVWIALRADASSTTIGSLIFLVLGGGWRFWRGISILKCSTQ